MCTIALAKVQQNYNCYNVYFYECLPSCDSWRLLVGVTSCATLGVTNCRSNCTDSQRVKCRVRRVSPNFVLLYVFWGLLGLHDFYGYKIFRKMEMIPVFIRSANMAPMMGTMRNGLTE